VGGQAAFVAWSADNRFLYVAGDLAAGSPPSLILRFSQQGRGDPESVRAGGENTECNISGILPLRNGSLLYSTSGRIGLGMLDPKWQVARLDSAALPSFLGLNLNQKFLLSQDGTSVRFAYAEQAREPAWFSVPKRQLAAGESAAGFQGVPPDEESIKLLGVGSGQIQLNGKVLKLLDGEAGGAYASVPGGRQFVLATQWRLILYDDAGKEQWQVSLPVDAEAVHVSGDGRLAVAALSDGTIHWYSLRDGKERLAFFPHPDRKRWLLWTPEGYYDGSPGAEEFFGYLTNHGPDQAAEFQPAAMVKEQYRRPDLVTAALK
jgi:hypothetical protein